MESVTKEIQEQQQRIGNKGGIGDQGDTGTTAGIGNKGGIGDQGDTGTTAGIGSKGGIGDQGDIGTTGSTGTQPGGAVPAGANEVLFINAGASQPTGDAKFIYTASTNILSNEDAGSSAQGLIHVSDDGSPTVSFPPYSFQSDTNSGFGNKQGATDQFAWYAGGNAFLASGSGSGTGNQEVGGEDTDLPFVPPRTEVEWQWSDVLATTDQWGKVLLVQDNGLVTTLAASTSSIGTQISMIFDGASGSFKFAADTGETVNGGTTVEIKERYGGITAIKVSSTAWIAVGNIT